MKPGDTARPSASTVWSAAPESLPSSTILPFLTATSPWKDGIPEPSTMRPLRIKRSYAIGVPPRLPRPACWQAAIYAAFITRAGAAAPGFCSTAARGGYARGALTQGDRIAGDDRAAGDDLRIDAHQIVAEDALQRADDVEIALGRLRIDLGRGAAGDRRDHPQ